MSLKGQSLGETLFIFIDESGNFDFSASGTRHFVMVGVVSPDPIQASLGMQELKYQILSTGHDFAAFHASQDQPWVRHEALRAISKLQELQVHVISGEKRSLPKSMQHGWKMHGLFAEKLIRLADRSFSTGSHKRVIVVLDQALKVSQQRTFQLAMRKELKDIGRPFHVFFHPMNSDFNGQIADYVAWAKFRQLERGDDGPWKILSQSLKPTEQNIFEGRG